MTSTTNYGLYQPLVNNSVDEDSWGSELNTDLSEIDTVLYTAMNLTASSQTGTITVTAPTAGSTTTGSSNTLYLCNASGGAFAANLPAASTATNMVVGFKKTDTSSNAITITGHSTDTIDGSNTQSLSSQYQYMILECDGTHWNIIAQTAPVPAGISGNIQTFTTSGTYTPTTGMVYCIVKMFGGGGGGGGTNATQYSAAGGGGAGGYSEAIFTSAQIGTSQTVTIGAGGLAGSNSGGTGGTGGTTSLGSLLTAAGGLGGVGCTSNSTGTAGGLGGAGTVNGVTTRGAPGGCSQTNVRGGIGGSTSLGGGGLEVPPGNSSNGNAGVANSGSGGSGACNSNSGGSALSGGVGGSGLVIITEYI